MKLRVYSGWNSTEGRTMFATVTGKIESGRASDTLFVYTECDRNGELLDLNKQYYRKFRYGTQCFHRF